ncbi:hypothetical protein ACJX0J_021057, partial [Zea mays]
SPTEPELFRWKQVPRVNAILFTGDRVRGTGDPVIERLSDAAHLAGVLAGKLPGEANAWVVDAARFAGPFAVYRELVPTVDAAGDPKGYDPTGFPAAAGVANILARSIGEIQNQVPGLSAKDSAGNQHPPSYHPPARTIILGFSKGGVVVNQLVTELSRWGASGSTNQAAAADVPRPAAAGPGPPPHPTQNDLLLLGAPTRSSDDLLSSISELHYVDAGLNRAGAYVADRAVIGRIREHVVRAGDKSLRFALHGTPRQWCDPSRPWIREEKDAMVQVLADEARRSEGRLVLSEKLYFEGRPRSLLMHFEVLE